MGTPEINYASSLVQFLGHSRCWLTEELNEAVAEVPQLVSHLSSLFLVPYSHHDQIISTKTSLSPHSWHRASAAPPLSTRPSHCSQEADFLLLPWEPRCLWSPRVPQPGRRLTELLPDGNGTVSVTGAVGRWNPVALAVPPSGSPSRAARPGRAEGYQQPTDGGQGGLRARRPGQFCAFD